MEQKNLTGYPSIDKPWLKYYSQEAINAPLPECSIYEYLWENNKDYPDDIAIIYFNRKITYGELFQNIDKTASALVALGVRQGEIVTIAMPSIPEALYTVYALNKIGAVANMIHPLAGEQELCNYLNEVESKVFLMFTGTYAIVKDALARTGVRTSVVVSPAQSLSPISKGLYRLKAKEAKIKPSAALMDWAAFIERGRGVQAEKVQKDCHEMALISHTGGTTGEPKGVMCSDRNANSLMHQIVCNFAYDRQGTSLAVLPPFINYSLIEAMMAMLAIGYKVVLIPDYKPLKFAKYVRQYHPNIVLSIPAYWEAILMIDNVYKTNMSCLEQIYAGGETMSQESEQRITKVLLACGSKTPLLKGLGSTEMTGGATQTYLNCNLSGSVGIPLVKVNCKIVELDTFKELSYNREGEICFSGPTLMIGYYNKQKETDEIVKIHSDGEKWLHTGDIGYINEDGVLFVTGRIKRIVMTRGSDGNITKLFPDRIEKAISAHPAVECCCVVCVPDEKRIHAPFAYVELKLEQLQDDEIKENIKQSCRELLPEYMVPERIEFCETLPRTDRGKIDYRALEERAIKEN